MVGRHCYRCPPGSLTVRTARRQSRSGRSKPVASEVCAARGRRLDQSLHTTEHPVDIPLTDRSDYYCSWPFVLVDTDVIAESHLPGRCYLQARQRTILGSILATLVSAAESYVGEDQSRGMSWLYDGVKISRLWLHISPLTTMVIIARRCKLCNSPFAVVIRDMDGHALDRPRGRLSRSILLEKRDNVRSTPAHVTPASSLLIPMMSNDQPSQGQGRVCALDNISIGKHRILTTDDGRPHNVHYQLIWTGSSD